MTAFAIFWHRICK